MRKYSKINTDTIEVEDLIKKIEKKLNIEIDCVLESDENGIYPVFKFTNK